MRESGEAETPGNTQKDRNQMGLGEGRTRELFSAVVPGGRVLVVCA